MMCRPFAALLVERGVANVPSTLRSPPPSRPLQPHACHPPVALFLRPPRIIAISSRVVWFGCLSNVLFETCNGLYGTVYSFISLPLIGDELRRQFIWAQPLQIFEYRGVALQEPHDQPAQPRHKLYEQLWLLLHPLPCLMV